MSITYEVTTSMSFDDAVENCKKCLSENNFGVLWELDFKDKLKEKGFEFDKNFKVFEVCNPGQAKEVLETNIEVGYFLPCKIVIYEKNDLTHVGMVNPSGFIGDMGSPKLASIAQEVESELKSAIDRTIQQ